VVYSAHAVARREFSPEHQTSGQSLQPATRKHVGVEVIHNFLSTLIVWYDSSKNQVLVQNFKCNSRQQSNDLFASEKTYCSRTFCRAIIDWAGSSQFISAQLQVLAIRHRPTDIVNSLRSEHWLKLLIVNLRVLFPYGMNEGFIQDLQNI
jgi:hypothetical protein